MIFVAIDALHHLIYLFLHIGNSLEIISISFLDSFNTIHHCNLVKYFLGY